MGEEKVVKSVYHICPCLFKYQEEYFCLGRSELHPLSLVLPVHVEIDLPTNDENACYDILYADNSGFIRCGSTGLPIRVRGKLVFEEVFGELYRLATSLFDPENICRECMYNLLSFEKIHRKLLFLFFTSGAQKCVEFERTLRETVEKMQVCEGDSIVQMKFTGKIKEVFKSRIKKLPTVYILDEKKKIGEIVGFLNRKELEKNLRKILGLDT